MIGSIRDIRRRRHVAHLCRLGDRAVDELLREIGAERSCMTAIEMKLERYSGLDRGVIAAARADRLDAREIRDGLVEIEGGLR